MAITIGTKSRKRVRLGNLRSNDTDANWYQHHNVEIRSGHDLSLLILNDPRLEADPTVMLLRPFLILPEKFRVRFYLSEKPDLYHPDIQHLLSDGLLEMHMSMNYHPNERKSYKYAFIEKGELSIINRFSNKLISKTDLYGFESNLRVVTSIELGDSDQLYKAIIDIESYMHVQLKLSIRNLIDGSLRRIRSIYPLRTVLKDQRLDHQKVIEYYYPNSNSGDYERLYLPQRKRSFGQKLKSNSLYQKGKSTKSINAMVRPTTMVSPHLLNTSLMSSPILNSNSYVLNNLVLAGKENNIIKSLPVVDNVVKKFWKDRKTSKKIWYQRSFRFIKPEANSPFEDSPFQFLFKKLGVDPMGNTVLEGTIKVSLMTFLDEALKNEIESTGNNLKLRAISTKDASYLLELPYLNSTGEPKKSHIVADTIEKKGSKVIITFRLTNEWIRVAYSLFAMSTDTNKARIIINYNFDGYTTIKKNELTLSAGFKISAMPLQLSANRSGNTEGVHFNMKNRTFMASNGLDIKFKDSTVKKKPKVAASTTTLATTSIKPVSIVSAPLISKINIIDKIKKEKKYAIQTFGRKEEVETEIPCINLGAFFQEENQHGEMSAVGCKDPYTLGQISIPLYHHLSEISNAHYGVYQSTQTPNRFLVVPKRYHISRKAKNVEDEYEPNVILYSTIDAVDLDKSNCVLDMVLEPDITAYDLYQLQKELKKYTAYEVKIDFITEVESENAEFTWTIPQDIAKEVIAFPLGKAIRVTIASDIEDMLTLKSMLESGSLSGRYRLAISETPTFETNLFPSLRSVTGPWDDGPLAISKEGNILTIDNKIESSINVSRVVFIKDSEEEISILNQAIAGKSSFEMNWDKNFDLAFAVYEVSSDLADINEIRNYIEDIECQVVLVNNIDYEQHNLDNAVVEIRLHNTTASHSVTLDKTDTARDITLLMPITDFLSSRVVEYRIKDHGDDWYSHNIAQEGNIINITSAYMITN